MYRDEQNRKTYGSVVFSNPEGLSAGQVFDELTGLLIDSELFVPNALGIPTLYPTNPADTGDHDYHEMEGVEETEEAPTDGRSMAEFLQVLQNWKSANPDEYW